MSQSKIAGVFTTGQVAEITTVSQQTIIKSFDSGQLRGYLVPGGSRDRRIPRESLLKFMKEHGLQTDWLYLWEHAHGIWVRGNKQYPEPIFFLSNKSQDEELFDQARELLKEEGFRPRMFSSSFELGLSCTDKYLAAVGFLSPAGSDFPVELSFLRELIPTQISDYNRVVIVAPFPTFEPSPIGCKGTSLPHKRCIGHAWQIMHEFALPTPVFA